MSSRSIASGFLASGSRRVFSKRRRRELGKAVAAVVEQLEKRVLLTNATLPASYTFDEGSHSAWSGWTVSTTPSDADIANDNYLSASSTLTVDTPYEHKSLHVHARIFILNVDFLDSPFDDPSGRFKVSVGGHDYTAGLIAVPENNSANLDDVGVHLGSQDWVWEADLDVPHVNSISNSNTASLTMSVQPNTGSSWGIDSVDVQYIDPKAPQCSCNCTVGPEGDSGTDANQLHSDAFGGGFDPSLFLSNSDQSVASDNGGNGSMGLPSLFQSVNGTVAAIDGASSSRWFDDAGGGSFTARYGVLDTLTHDSGNHTYSITDSSGQVSTYNDFTNGTASLRGKLIEVTDPSGTGDPNTTSYSYSSGKLSKIERTDGSGDYVRYNYTYLSSGSNSGKISSITLEEETGGTATPVRSEVFDYYTGGSGVDSHGHLGDLKSVILKDGGTNGATIDTTYYRYWTTGNTNTATLGYVGGLQMVLGPASYARAVAAGNDPLASDVNDPTLKSFADTYFEYDPSTHRVSAKAVQGEGCSACSGGVGNYTYAYTASGIGFGFNTWANKVEETLPDGNKNITYYNTYQQPILTIFQDTTANKLWGTFYKYDSSGRQILMAHPSALALPTSVATIEAFPDLLHANAAGNYEYMNDTTGKIDVTDYYMETDGGIDDDTAGGVDGYVEDTKLQHGELAVESGKTVTYTNLTHSGTTALVTLTGHGYADDDVVLVTGASPSAYNGLFTIHVTGDDTFEYTMLTDPGADASNTKIVVYRTNQPITLSSTDYFEHSGGGNTVHPLADVIRYHNTSESGGQTTSYVYDWYTSSTQIKSMEVSRPVVAYTNNGSGSADTDMTFYDVYGRTTWTMDASGYINYTAYDTLSGAVKTAITDVDTSQTSEFSGKPTGWTTPATGGLNLITTYDVDALGRPKVITDPKGNLTYIVYKDSSHEIRTYPGFDGTHTTGPIQIHRDDRDGSFIEDITLKTAPHLDGSNHPDGGESITRADIRSLVRNIISKGGQTIESDRYFDLGSETYATGHAHVQIGSVNTNFYGTTYGYDDRGRQNHIVNAVGTITDTVYDGLGRVVSTWVGTDDIPSSDLNSDGSTDYEDFLDTVASGGSVPSGANMVKVSENLYDSYDPAAVIVGDSNLTRSIRYPGGGATARVDDFFFDWRDRQVTAKFGVALSGSGTAAAATEGLTDQRQIIYYTYDNLDRVVQADQYDGDQVNMSATNSANALLDTNYDGVPDAPGTNTLRAHMTSEYDDQDRVWRTKVFSVNQSTGAIGSNSLKTWNWYDPRGNVIKNAPPGGLVAKYSYDGAGRLIAQYATNGGGDDDPGESGTLGNAKELIGDTVFQQVNNTYDENSNLIFSVTRMRFHDAAAPESNSGDLSISPASGSARVSYQAFYYDLANRPTASVDHGTNGGFSLSSRPAVPTGRDIISSTATSNGSTTTLVDTTRTEESDYWIGATIKFTLSGQIRTVTGYDGTSHTLTFSPAASSTTTTMAYTLTPNALVSTYAYNDAGWQSSTTDPRGLTNTASYDLLGRTTETIANYRDGVAANADDDQITDYTYDGNDNILTMKAVVNNSGTNNVFQTTQYIYGVVAGTNAADSNITSNDLLKKIEYPDQTTGNASTNSANIEAFSYNAAGDRKTLSDRNGNVHTYGYDVLGRLLIDGVTTLGSGVDGAVRAIVYTYDTAGRPFQLTNSCCCDGSGTVASQIQYDYNGYADLITEYQEHTGAVCTGSAPKVQYTYSEGGADPGPDGNNDRLKAIVYPNGRIVRYEYGTSGGLADKISRLSFISDDTSGSVGAHIEDYQYLGLSTVVIRNRPNGNSKLTYVADDTLTGDAGDQYTGLDRFGRIVDQRWIGQSGSNTTTLDDFAYAYDANSNPLYKKNLVDGSFSELYHANGTNGAGTSYDGLNRLTDFRRGTLSDVNSDGVYDTVTTANTLAGSVKNWSLDAVGNWNSSTTGTNSAVVRTNNKQNQSTVVGANTLSFDSAGSVTIDESGKHYTYDAWNRMVEAWTASCCCGHTTIESRYYDAAGRIITQSGTDLYYSSQWQVLEERVSNLATTQYVWSPTYVDELIERDRNADSSADGTLDTSFDGDGKVTTSFGSSGLNVDDAMAVVVQPDGKTIAVGFDGSYVVLARYNVNGSLDTTFGTGGKVQADILSQLSQVGLSVALQSDGKILVAVSNDAGASFSIARFTATGGLDSSFGTGGKKTITIYSGAGSYNSAVAVAVEPDDKIILGGTAYDGHHHISHAAAVRLHSDGSIDTTYDNGGAAGDGIAISADAVNFDFVTTMALQDDGSVVLGGIDGNDFAFTRFTPTGTVDSGFGSSGFTDVSFGGTNAATLSSLTLQADGTIVAVGDINGDFALARLTTAGVLDSTFGSSGTQTSNLGGTDIARGVRMQSDGRIVVVGDTGGNLAVARYTTGGILDTTFDSDGYLTTDLGSSADLGNALWIGPDYKITTAGRTGTNGATYDIAVDRYKVSSSLEERLYATTDANHNVTSIDDVFGAVKERFVYDPYRNSTVLTSAWATTSDTYSFTVRSQGEREDSVTNTIDGRSRFYGLGIGRWMQADVAGYVDGVNRYQSLVSNPVNYVDPTGMEITVGDPTVVSTITLSAWLEGKALPTKWYGETGLGLDAKTSKQPPSFAVTLKQTVECTVVNGELRYKVTFSGHYEPNFHITIEVTQIVLDAHAEADANQPTLGKLKAAIAAFNQFTIQHEQHHVADTKRIFTAFDIKGSGVAATEIDAAIVALDELDSRRVATIAKMMAAAKAASDAFHAEAGPIQDALTGNIYNAWAGL